jgi:acetylornithine/succinyldiaminopimelate/putrescine aminotransferase
VALAVCLSECVHVARDLWPWPSVYFRVRACCQGLVALAAKYPIIDIRGRGLMVAAEFGSPAAGYEIEPGTAHGLAKYGTAAQARHTQT